MIGFANPWAWIGALALALPVGVHLLRRHRATRRSFPTLKFLPEARVVAVRRHRLTDISLMVVRLLIVAAAVVALAQPIWRDRASASRATSSELARAVVIDRTVAQAPRAVGGDTATTQVITEAADLRAGLASAIGWVARQTGRREIAVVSAFPIGSLAASDLAKVPAGVGVRLLQSPSIADEHPIGPPLARGASMRALAPHLTLRPGETTVTWAEAGAAASPAIDWRVKAADASGLTIATGAALDVGVPPRASDRPVTIVLADAPDRAQLVSNARPIDQPWMFDVIRALPADATLASAARSTPAPRAGGPDSLTPVVRDGAGLVLLAAGSVGSNPSQLLLTSNAPAASIFTAALEATVADRTRATPWSTLEPDVIARDELTRWERPIASSPGVVLPTAGEPLGHWLWIVALVWIAFETWWRRRMDALDAPPVVNRRVA